MNSFEWRLKQLEEKILAKQDHRSIYDQGPICDQLLEVAKKFQVHGNKYKKFLDQYNEFKNQALEDDIDTVSKAELVLSYENDLVRYFENLKSMADKADKVLDIEKWPDLLGYEAKLQKLQTITSKQAEESKLLDQRIEKLIEIYNDIITTFKYNMSIWNNSIEAHENAERSKE